METKELTVYEDLIKRLRNWSKYPHNLANEAADAIEMLARDFAIIEYLNHDKDIKIEQLQEELNRLRESLDFARTKDAEIIRLGTELELLREWDAAIKDFEKENQTCGSKECPYQTGGNCPASEGCGGFEEADHD